MVIFKDAVAKIEEKYALLGHQLGWRFLYTPARTLSGGTKIHFVGQNPGGSKYEPPKASVEEGNAYRVEDWGDSGLQKQICLLYSLIARGLGQQSHYRLMDDTLAANFCPFRSAGWAELPKKPESVEFSRRLWGEILEDISPSVIICMGEVPYDNIRELLLEKGYGDTPTDSDNRVGWGNVEYRDTHLSLGDRGLYLLGLPHLSRFPIFGRPGSYSAVARFTGEIVKALQ